MSWDFDEDLGGTFALDKIAAGETPDTPIDEITDPTGGRADH